MSDHIKKMVDEAIRFIDSLSVDELEKEFKSFGLSAVRRNDDQYFTPIKVTDFSYISSTTLVTSANDEVFCLASGVYSIAA